jgi:hypothetical protein
MLIKSCPASGLAVLFNGAELYRDLTAMDAISHCRI